MDKKTIYIKTARGEHEAVNLSSDLKRILSLIDGKSKADELAKRAPPSLRESWNEILSELIAGGYIVDKNQPHVEPKIAKPKFNPLKMFGSKPAEIFVPKPAAQPPSGDLDFSAMNPVRAPDNAELAVKQKVDAAVRARADLEAAELAAKQKTEAAARARIELEASVAAAKAKADAEAAVRIQAKAKLEAEIAARAKAEAEVKARQEALIRGQAEEKAKQEAALKLQAQNEAARAKAAQEVAARAKAEAEARVRAEIEAAARAQQEAEAKSKREAEAARLKVEQESLRIKSELEAVSKAKADAEAARLKAVEEAERVKAELEATKARVEAEAKALVEARIRRESEEKARKEAEAARVKAEEEAARVKAELEAAKARAEAEAKARAEAEAKARAEAEAKARAEAEAKARAEAEAKARAEAEAKARAEAEALVEAQIRREVEEKAAQEIETRLKAEKESARIRAEHEVMTKANAEAEAASKRLEEELAKRVAEQDALARVDKEGTEPSSLPAFEIKLDGFLAGLDSANKTSTTVAKVDVQVGAEDEDKDRQEAEQRAAAEAKAEAEKAKAKNAAAEMARLKEEAEESRRKAEAEARRLAEEQLLAEEQSKAWAEAEQRAKAQAVFEVEQAAQQAALSQAKAKKKSTVRVHREPLPLGKIFAGLVVSALVAIGLLPYLYPLNEYIAPLEQRLSTQLKQPVHIGGLSASSLPPKLQLHNVTVGNAQEIKVGSIVLNFDVFSLLSEVKVISNAELEDVSIDGRLLDKQAASMKLLGSDSKYPVRHLTLQKLKVVTDELALPVFSGIADLDAQGAFSRVSLHSADDKVGIDLQSNQGHWQLGVNLKESALPSMPDVVFSDLSAKGDLSDGEVNFTELDAHIYNGILLGSAKFNWRNGWQLQGRLEAKTFELSFMFPKYRVDGDMYGEGTFSMSSSKLSQLGDAPHLDGSFTVKNGSVNGFDMVETARLLSREHLKGGRTHFDELSGLVQLENHTSRFRQIKVASGILSANGSFDVRQNNQLSGNFSAEIKMRPGVNALTFFGTLAEPKLRAGN